MSTQSTTCEYEYPEEGEERVAEDVHEHHCDAHRPNHRMLVHPAPAAGRSGGRKRPGVSTSSTHPAPAGRAGPACLSAAASTAPTPAYPPGRRALWETSNGRFGPRRISRDWQGRKLLHFPNSSRESPVPAAAWPPFQIAPARLLLRCQCSLPRPNSLGRVQQHRTVCACCPALHVAWCMFDGCMCQLHDA